jgi:hypothetical protein
MHGGFPEQVLARGPLPQFSQSHQVTQYYLGISSKEITTNTAVVERTSEEEVEYQYFHRKAAQ